MDATAYELKTILGNERRFLIPTFQRDYEWTKEGQWSLLFDDLVTTAARLADARAHDLLTGGSTASAEKRIAPHFLGAVVLDQLASKAGEIDQRAVIDGQQRLTTIQLLLRALADVLAEIGSARASALRRLLFNPLDDPTADLDTRYKLWPRRKDRDLWRAAMDDDMSKAPVEHLYGKARLYFAERIREVAGVGEPQAVLGRDEVPEGGDIDLDGAGGIDRVELDTLVDAAMGLFKIVSIDLDENDDPQVIFEVLNGRQTPLSAADLVKNLLFLRAEISDEAALEALHDQYWAPLETNWWRTPVGRGHAARHRRELLLGAWLSAQTGEEANVGHLYGEIRRYLNEQGRTVREVLTEIGLYRAAYHQISEPAELELGARAADAYRRLNRLGITTAYPLLLWLKTLPTDLLSIAEHERVAVAIESWAIRRLVTKRNTRGYGKAFLGVLARAKTAKATGENIAAAVVDALATGSLDWPTDGEVIASFERESFYRYHSQERVRMILGAIDEKLAASRPKAEPTSVEYDKLHIEHLLPQNWRAHWPLPPGDPASAQLASDERNQALNRIGNLTLLTQALNSALSNGAWASKQRAIRDSKLHLNHEFLEEMRWDEEAITARGRRLAEIAIEIWPGPGSGQGDDPITSGTR